LAVWQKAVDLCESVYALTAQFPAAERFGLTGQMRRAVVSVPSNLTEGYGRGSRRDYRQFVCVARGSAAELETQITIASRLRLLDVDDCERFLSATREILRMLHSLAEALDT
jgi:four helix bundle protein